VILSGIIHQTVALLPIVMLIARTVAMPAIPYRGRFAPSPTGLLHAGSLMTAVGSYLEARSRGGEWWVRMEDLDPPREMPGAADDILRTLEAFGFEWDGEVVYQSQRHHLYQAALQQLIDSGHVYPCSCSRKEITSVASVVWMAMSIPAGVGTAAAAA
jgi:glutamyl-Q tRNA(Asp) synthetase